MQLVEFGLALFGLHPLPTSWTFSEIWSRRDQAFWMSRPFTQPSRPRLQRHDGKSTTYEVSSEAFLTKLHA